MALSLALPLVVTLLAAPCGVQQHAWKPGERVEIWSRRMGSDASTSYSWRKATIIDVMPWGGAHAKCDDDPNYVENLGLYDANAAARHDVSAARPLGWDPKSTEPVVPKGTVPCDPGIRVRPRSNAPSVALFKHLILEHYETAIDGSLTSPLKVGVTFQDFSIGLTTKNTLGRYGWDHPSARANGTIYPIRTHHTLWRMYRDSTPHKVYDGYFEAFVDRQGQWTIATAPGYRELP